MSEDKRFGGKFSPGAAKGAAPTPDATRFSGRKASRIRWRIVGLYLAPTPLLITALDAMLSAEAGRILWSAGGWALLIGAAVLTREGLDAAEAYEARAVAKPPAFPRKLCGAALTGLTVAGVAWIGAQAGVASLIYGAMAGGLMAWVFGPDPMRAKGIGGIEGAEAARVAGHLDKAEAALDAALADAQRLKDRALADKVTRLAGEARGILNEIGRDPGDFRRSRAFLSVHLNGLAEATRKYADATEKGVTGRREDFVDLLTEMETSIARRRRALLTDDAVELDVEIDVLRDRLKRENAR